MKSAVPVNPGVSTVTGNAVVAAGRRVVDPNDPMSIMGKAVGGTFADPFKGTSRAGSTL
jgi:hypothetical protein